MTVGIYGNEFSGTSAERAGHIPRENDRWLDTETNHHYWYHGGGWVDLSSGSAPGGAEWGNISGTLSDQTDLQNALNGKAASSHTQAKSTITDFAHTHPESEIVNLVSDLAGKEPANANIQAHVISAHAPSNAQKNSDILKAEIEAKLTGEISTHTHAGGGSFSIKGFMPYAVPINYVGNAAFTTALAMAANGGSIAVPVQLTMPLNLQSVSVRNTDTATARTWGWDLYEQVLTTDSILTRRAASSANETFTPSAASTRTIAAASAPVVLPAGLYWLVVQNRHATSTFGLGSTASSSAFALSTAQTKTTTNPNGATLDFIAATWTKVTAIYAVRLNGRVFGQAASF